MSRTTRCFNFLPNADNFILCRNSFPLQDSWYNIISQMSLKNENALRFDIYRAHQNINYVNLVTMIVLGSSVIRTVILVNRNNIKLVLSFWKYFTTVKKHFAVVALLKIIGNTLIHVCVDGPNRMPRDIWITRVNLLVLCISSLGTEQVIDIAK